MSKSLDLYFKEISKYPILSRDDERAFGLRAMEGSIRARNRLVECNLRFVVTVARRYMNQGIDLEDLIGSGNLGMMIAAERYNPETGYKFITYAIWWIKQAILKSLADSRQSVRMPANKVALRIKRLRAEEELIRSLGREPFDDEIADYMEIDVKNLPIAQHFIDIDASFDDEGKSRIEIFEDKNTDSPEKAMIIESLKEEINIALENFSQRERDIIKLYHGIGEKRSMTLEEIGYLYGISRERVRQIKKVLLKRLKFKFKANILNEYLGEDLV